MEKLKENVERMEEELRTLRADNLKLRDSITIANYETKRGQAILSSILKEYDIVFLDGCKHNTYDWENDAKEIMMILSLVYDQLEKTEQLLNN